MVLLLLQVILLFQYGGNKICIRKFYKTKRGKIDHTLYADILHSFPKLIQEEEGESKFLLLLKS